MVGLCSAAGKKPSENPTNRRVPSVTDVTILLELDAALSASGPSASQIAVQPPSTENSMPVTKLEASLASHMAALATSSGVPRRFMG